MKAKVDGNSPKMSRVEVKDVVIRFAGDSGDGIQLTGTQFSTATALAGNDVVTLPDFPAEIRAPAGTLPGVSAYQIHFSSFDIHTPGGSPDVLVAMNPAALKLELPDLKPNGILIANEDAFTQRNLERVGFSKNPLEDQSLAAYRLIRVPLSTVTRKALESSSITPKEKDRCKNFTALGIMFWLYNRSMETTQRWVETKFKSRPELIEANLLALKGGLEYARATEIFQTTYDVPPAPMAPGVYRSVSGNSALAMGLVAAANRAGVTLFQGSYPITPASDILHELSRYKHFNVITFQAEDEIAAVTSAIGASYAGALGITSTSGPGVALKGEAMGLAVMTELPLVIIDVMRGGPSTGMPTKLEQSDLLMALFGRHGESPLPVIAPATPGDCFWAAFEAARIAIRYMTPVMLLSDGYLANGAEPFKVPDVADLPTVKVSYAPASSNGEPFRPYARDPKTLARPWAKPGTPGLEHRIGGLEKSDGTGNVDYDAQNHERMVRIRADKVSRVLDDLPPTEVFGPDRGDLVVLGWGSTYGAIRGALTRAVDRGLSVAHVHIRHLNPLPRDLGEILSRYRTVLIPELNSGHLLLLVRAKYLIDAVGLSKIQGKPFTVEEILDKVEQLLEAKQS